MKQHSKKNRSSQTTFGFMTNIIDMTKTNCMSKENAKMIHPRNLKSEVGQTNLSATSHVPRSWIM
jgi:hypothetical protein